MMKTNPFFSALFSVSGLALLAACSGQAETDSRNSAEAAVTGSTQQTSNTETIKADSNKTAKSPDAPFVVGEITVPAGFSINVFHEGVGRRARHIAVRDNGDVLIARMDGTLIGVRDTDGDGIADETVERKVPITTGLGIRGDWLYFSDRVSVSRVKFDGNLVPQGDVETIVSGFPLERQHAEKTFAMDGDGNLYVNSGAPSNACQEKSRTPGSPGLLPCPQLENYAGVWRFKGDITGQTPADGVLYATGVRNAMAIDWSEQQNGLMIAGHGRDQLSALWPDYYTDEQSAILPAEEVHFVSEGADLGWPYTYYDQTKSIRYVAPEYGGDGQKTPEEKYNDPLYGFPGHWAPNDMLVINDSGLPAPYNEGALIAFHGSWNRGKQLMRLHYTVLVNHYH